MSVASPLKRHKTTCTMCNVFARVFSCRDETAGEPGALSSPGSSGLLWLVWGPVKPSRALQQHLLQNPQDWKNIQSFLIPPPFSFISTSVYIRIFLFCFVQFK